MRFTGTAPSAWLVACVGMFVAAHGWAFALPPDTPVAKREAQTMRAVPEHNFQAINEENLKKLLGTASRYTGTQQEMVEFAAEAKQMFRDTDVYMRLVEFTLTDFAPPIAYATVIQFTLPADERGSDVGLANRKLGTTHFRSNSALLQRIRNVQLPPAIQLRGRLVADNLWIDKAITPASVAHRPSLAGASVVCRPRRSFSRQSDKQADAGRDDYS